MEDIPEYLKDRKLRLSKKEMKVLRNPILNQMNKIKKKMRKNEQIEVHLRECSSCRYEILFNYFFPEIWFDKLTVKPVQLKASDTFRV